MSTLTRFGDPNSAETTHIAVSAIEVPSARYSRIDPVPEGTEVRVMVVDDYQEMRDALADLLVQIPGLSVVCVAANGIEAIEGFQAHAPDVIVMDMRMPQMDGTIATRQITAAGSRTRVLMLSAYGDESLVREAIRAGAASFLLKGTPPSQIAEAVIATAQGRHCFSEELLKFPVDQLLMEQRRATDVKSPHDGEVSPDEV